eukprot:1151186-Pelagomonas_calceolata.AAC.5
MAFGASGHPCVPTAAYPLTVQPPAVAGPLACRTLPVLCFAATAGISAVSTCTLVVRFLDHAVQHTTKNQVNEREDYPAHS